MSADTKQNASRIQETALRRVWQPPQAKAVEVATVTRNTLSGIGDDGGGGGGCNS